MRFQTGLFKHGEIVTTLLSFSFLIILAACTASGPGSTTGSGSPAARSSSSSTADTSTPEGFIADAEKTLNELNIEASRASWVQANFITDDTEALAAEANKVTIEKVTQLAEDSRKFDGKSVSPEIARKIKLLKLALTLPAPKDAAERTELTKIAASMESAYGRGKYCPDGPDKPCMSLGDLEEKLASSRNPDELKRIWLGWHDSVSPPYRKDYGRYVELGNKGAREMGFKDLGAMWRSNYDMEPDAFAAEMERLWLQVKPLYDSLYNYTRRQLIKKYGTSVVPESGPIPAHLFGNMWSQDWTNIYPLLKPATSDPGYDLTAILVQRKTDPKQMVKYGESFFTSLGMRSLPDTFWKRSLLVKPADREVVCHASAWDIDQQQDVRIKMCIKINAEDFATIHHELGHNYYQMAYAPQTALFQGSANDGFHEALGDTIALSVTPEYLKQIGLIQKVPDEKADIGLLLNKALEKVAFLPFGYLMDQWRWKVFSGEIGPGDYNKGWWELREKYQGISAPSPRDESKFDAGAKYHIAGNTPYARYFLATILQFQFHRALCKQAGYQGPLNRCSIYGNKAVGAKIEEMMKLGLSHPWPEALKVLTGEDKMDATAIIDYFAPLKKWLDEQK